MFADLRPYICILEDCNISTIFGSQMEFEQHLATHALIDAIICPICNNTEHDIHHFNRNFRLAHPSETMSSAIKPTKVPRDLDSQPCPFCAEIPGSKDFVSHVSRHCEEVAMSSLSRAFGEDSDSDDGDDSSERAPLNFSTEVPDTLEERDLLALHEQAAGDGSSQVYAESLGSFFTVEERGFMRTVNAKTSVTSRLLSLFRRGRTRQPGKDYPDGPEFDGSLDLVRVITEQERPETEPSADAIRGAAAIVRTLSVTRQKVEAEEARRARREAEARRVRVHEANEVAILTRREAEKARRAHWEAEGRRAYEEADEARRAHEEALRDLNPIAK